MSMKINRKLNKALKLAVAIPLAPEKGNPKNYFSEAVQIASYLHDEDLMCVALLHGLFVYTKMSGYDLFTLGYSREVVQAIKALTTKNEKFAISDQASILASPMAMKVFLAMVHVRGAAMVEQPLFIHECQKELEKTAPFALLSQNDAEMIRQELIAASNRG
ncbi:MAG: hypothetical protein NTV44_04030 [Firmicutes bacterium]|nr:hypothetical protein [Bacillota bacterium]